MNNNNYNIRKKQILAILSYAVYPYTAKKIANLCPVSLSCVSALLKRYVRQGLLKRVKRDYNYVYWITEKGENRLNYFLNIKKQVGLLVREEIRLK